MPELEVDHYNEIRKAMREGLLITCNNSGGANAPGTGELRVETNTRSGQVLLRGANDRLYRLHPETSGKMVLHELDEEGRKKDVVSVVETIEVIGVDG